MPSILRDESWKIELWTEVHHLLIGIPTDTQPSTACPSIELQRKAGLDMRKMLYLLVFQM